MKRLAVFSVVCWALVARAGSAPTAAVTAVRHWSLGEVTRIAVEVSGDFHYRSDRLHNPERIYFDISKAHNGLGVRYYAEDVEDPVVKRIRVAEASPGTTRVVIDLSGDIHATTTQLANPGRLIIELRSVASPAPPIPTKLVVPELDMRKPDLPKPPPTIQAGQAAPGAVAPEPLKLSLTPAAAAPNPPALAKASPAVPNPTLVAKAVTPPPAQPNPPPTRASTAQPNPPLMAKIAEAAPLPKDATKSADLPAPEVGKAARRTANGETSLIRALGLKLNRVVIDPGHGGQDQGTAGAKGLLEKDLVLDIALRAGALIEDRLRAEVIYTRSTDVFIPLESRTALANEKKADLFLSIHANASTVPSVSGVETYFLNFTEARDALVVAARENANSAESISELRDLIQKITLHEKAEESRDLAGSIQSSLFGLYVKGFPGEHDRGVRRAPFVVLIGASMPSVLAEIGFLSNPKEETLLRKPEYRQKVAEALVRGVERYASGLSHFQVAQNK
ncbi:MAG: N-acetylmuramoyl-L-alanine amidase [Bryobacteraceae bacterium]